MFNKSSDSSLNSQIICAYACPSTEWRNEPFPWNNKDTIFMDKKDIATYKQMFIDLFNEMESQHGKCTSINIKRNDNGINVEIIY